MNIKVLGSGCARCKTLLAAAKEAAANAGTGADVEYVTDMAAIAGYNVMSLPALVVDEKVVSAGKVLKASEVEKFLR